MKKAILISVLLLPMLTGCALFDFFKKPEPPAIVTPRVILIDSENLKECELLPRIENPNPTQEELDSLKFLWIDKYGVCANRQRNSVKVIKELANIKESK